MGQKTHPRGFRLVITKNWSSNWYSPKATFKDKLFEDISIRKLLMKQPVCQGVAEIKIKRMGDKIEVTIRTARPGLIIGKKGAEIEKLKALLEKHTKKEIWLEVEEVKRPDTEAVLVASGIAMQLEKRASFRRVMKRAIQISMEAGAQGIKVMCSGRLAGADIARSEVYKKGKIPMQTLRYDIDYAEVRAKTTYGILGVKVWINRGEMGEAKPA